MIYITIPTICPECGKPLKIITSENTKKLVCQNTFCKGQILKTLTHFCDRKAKGGLDIKGLSEASLEKFINWGFISSFEDLFNLKNHKSKLIKREGFGEKSVQKLLDSIEQSRHCILEDFISALGVPLMGKAMAKILCNHFSTWEDLRNAITTHYSFDNIAGIGPEIKDSLLSFDWSIGDTLVEKGIIIFSISKETKEEKPLDGKTFVITGKLKTFKNRNELSNYIEENGGKVVNSVSKKTSYLINNDTESTSEKNKKAKDLNIPIISEKDFINMFKKGD